MGLIRRIFILLDAEIFKGLFKVLIRPHVENASQIEEAETANIDIQKSTEKSTIRNLQDTHWEI